MYRIGSCISRLRTCPRTTPSTWHLRRLHTPKQLKYRIEEGLGEFLPPPALQVVGVEYQQGLLDRLNEEVRGTELEGMSIVDTIVKTSVERNNVLAFNYASLALNNHFFLEHLRPIPNDAGDHQHQISLRLQEEIRRQHGSLAQLKSTFSAAALGMFTNGWVWLVTDAHGNIAVLPTFGPGTLLVRSRTYMAPTHNSELDVDMLQSVRGKPLTPDDPYAEEAGESSSPSSSNPTSRQSPPGVSPSSPASGVSGPNTGLPPNSPQSRSIHTTLARRQEDTLQAGIYGNDPSNPRRGLNRSDLYLLGQQVYPLFCVSVNEHAWMSAGYGVWGKEEWLKKFWSVLDWSKVSFNYDWYTTTEAKQEAMDKD
ncbi:hypothetical protein V5O48_001087 [Marasmius crinis-equi]|uniref:Manganese/iron superoxide dismutase C-terminal domain-containing protein n=1 Tax=Marasmius crinis-equi TaxID=585013 RepID=A0ABR3FZD1_9AGAR